LYRGINEFKRGYQPIRNCVRNQNCDLLADSHISLNMWKNYFSQLLNVNNVSAVKQIEVHTAEPLVPGPSRLEVEIAIAKLKKYKSPGSDLRSANSLILFGIRKNCLISARSLLLYQFTERSKSGYKNSKQIVWKCVTVQIFGDDINNSKFDSGGNQEETEFW
jgi:hypothetical protein